MKTEGWEVRLSELVNQHMRTPWERGTHDCITWIADCILTMTGADPIADLRGTWWDDETAEAAMAPYGGSFVAALDSFYHRKDVAFAHRGDVVLVKDADGKPSVAICIGMSWCAPGDDGMVILPMKRARIAWEVA